MFNPHTVLKALYKFLYIFKKDRRNYITNMIAMNNIKNVYMSFLHDRVYECKR